MNGLPVCFSYLIPWAGMQAYWKAFQDNRYDALLLPGVGVTAPKHGMVRSANSECLQWASACVPFEGDHVHLTSYMKCGIGV